jgi:hypothetical protein
MEAMREAGTDERLDDLNGKVDWGFDRVEARFSQVDARLDAMQAHTDKRLDGMQNNLDRRFESIDTRLDGLHRVLIVTQTTFILGLLGLVATQI